MSILHQDIVVIRQVLNVVSIHDLFKMKIYLAFFGISAIYLWQCLGTLKQEAAICNYNGILGKFNKLQSINQIANLNIIIFYQSEFYTIKISYCIFSEHIKVPFVYLLLLFFLRDCKVKVKLLLRSK